jgi:hypothetical protein
MQDSRISHVGSHGGSHDESETKSETRCINIKSRKDPKKQCENLATHGNLCGVHFKHPRVWAPSSPETIGGRVRAKNIRKILSTGETGECAAKKLQRWWRLAHGLRLRRAHGPAYWYRALCTNDSDFFSTDPVSDISGVSFFSYKDVDNHVYGFDVRSIHTLIYRARTAGETPLNPFTRSPLPTGVLRNVLGCVRVLSKRRLPTEWAPLTPPTPEQQMRMKIVDIFSKIDELNYYSSPEWFLEMESDDHRNFYAHLHNIWTHRAGLSMAQKNTIVPGFHTRLFRFAHWALADQSIESLQRMNLQVIRLLITSATDRNDRILGAMYVISALTLVSDSARTAYPWLYESVVEEAPAPERRPAIVRVLGVGWLNDLMVLRQRLEAAPPVVPPPLALPPPHQEGGTD